MDTPFTKYPVNVSTFHQDYAAFIVPTLPGHAACPCGRKQILASDPGWREALNCGHCAGSMTQFVKALEQADPALIEIRLNNPSNRYEPRAKKRLRQLKLF